MKRYVLDDLSQIQRDYLTCEQRPGHIWTGRLNMAGLISDIDRWLDANGNDIEIVELRDYIRSTPHGQYSHQQCVEALHLETRKYRGEV